VGFHLGEEGLKKLAGSPVLKAKKLDDVILPNHEE